MASQLRDLAAPWTDIRYLPLNAVFTEDRDQLGKFSFGKIRRLLGYLGETVIVRLRDKAKTIIVHPAFHPAPFLKESLFIWLASLMGMRVIAWIHMDPNRLRLESRSAIFQKWVHLTLGRVDTFVACAPSLIGTWPGWLASHKAIGIANVIADPSKNDPQHSHLRSEERLLIVYLSAIDPEKGWRELYEAALRICDSNNSVEFHFYGGIGMGENANDVSTLFRSSRHADRILHLGPVQGEDKFHRLREADLFIFPSHTEQFPLTILEAMACGLPIISTNVGAVSDALLVPDGGAFFSAGSTESLVSTISSLLENPGNLPAMGSFNLKRFRSNLSIENFERSWHALLQEQYKTP